MTVSKLVYNILFNVLVAIIMSFMMSLALTAINVWVPAVGLPQGFMLMWMRSFVVAVVVSIPITFAAIPLVRKILSRVQVRS